MCSVLDGRGMTVPPEIMELAPKTLADVLSWPSFSFPRRWHEAPAVPGVYCVVVDGAHLIYAGATARTLRIRWATHHLASAIVQFGEPRIHYQQVDDDRLQFWLEIAVMQQFSPILNGRSMSVIAIDTLPDGRKGFRPRKPLTP